MPLAAVSAPQHLFVRFILDGEEINWETTSAEELGNDDYRSWLKISDKAISKGVYLRNLTRQETMAFVYNNRGVAWANKGNLDNAIADYNEVIRLNPNFADAYYNRGIIKLKKLNLIGAGADFMRAVLPILR